MRGNVVDASKKPLGLWGKSMTEERDEMELRYEKARERTISNNQRPNDGENAAPLRTFRALVTKERSISSRFCVRCAQPRVAGHLEARRTDMANDSEPDSVENSAEIPRVEENQIQHLSQIQTRWSMIFEAHQGPPDAASKALEGLMMRYCGAVNRYLIGITRDPELANDLSQEFALRFARGDFRRADPRFGRFRNFVKTAVMNLVIDHHRRKKTRPQVHLPDGIEPEAVEPDLNEMDQRFLDCWREQIFQSAWAELERLEERTGQPFYSVLKARTDCPDLHSPELAAILSEKLERPVTAGWFRQTLLRSRERFVEFIIEDVSLSLGSPSAEYVDEELMDLGLWDYCKSARNR